MSRHSWLIALGLSLLLHLAIIGGPGWRLPFFDGPATTEILEAHLLPTPQPPRLAPAPPPAAARPGRPQPGRQPPPAGPSRPQAVPPTSAGPAGAEQGAPVAADPAPVAAPAVVTDSVETSWPRQGRIRFSVSRGEGERGMQIGQSSHSWQHDGRHYLLRTVSETTGLVALFRPATIVQTSEGELTADGLVPREFRVERDGRTAERARFDWESGKVMLASGRGKLREAPLAPGAQDLLSQIYQIGLAGIAARIEMMIATGKNYGRYAYEAVGDEMLATPFGALRAWHVKTPALPGEQAMELWLASDYRNLPLRILYHDRKGEVYDQNVVDFEVDGVRLAAGEK